MSLPGQLLFGVARMTLSAVVTLYLISLAHLQLTGTYLFFDSHIPLPVFLGMHLLFTDPSTSPRSAPARRFRNCPSATPSSSASRADTSFGRSDGRFSSESGVPTGAKTRTTAAA